MKDSFKPVNISIPEMFEDHVRIQIKGFAYDDEVDARKISENGPMFFLAFNYDRERIEEVADEFIRIGTILKTIKE